MNIKVIFTVSLFIMVLSIYFACTIYSDKPAMVQPEIIWSDEFDGEKLDESKWIHRRPGKRRDAINVEEAVSLDGKGNLIIATSKVENEYHTGMIATDTKFEHKFGYWETRMRFQTQPGHWSAFWLQSPEVAKTGDPGRYGVEIDIIEFLVNKGDTVLNNLHWDGYGKEHKHAGKRTLFPGLSRGFHKIGLWWKENEYIFYVDDQPVWCTRQAVSKRPQYIILSCEVGKWAGDISQASLPDSLIVDYVRVYNTRP